MDRLDAGGVSGTGDTAGILGSTGRNATDAADVTNYQRENERRQQQSQENGLPPSRKLAGTGDRFRFGRPAAKKKNMRAEGLEPSTHGLKVRCSTD